MAEQTANTTKINVEIEYTFDHASEDVLKACSVDLHNSKEFEDLFNRFKSGEFEGKRPSEIIQMILEDQKPELIRAFIVTGIVRHMDAMEKFFSSELIRSLLEQDPDTMPQA